MRSYIKLSPLCLSILAGCSIGPDYMPPETLTDMRYSDIVHENEPSISSGIALELAWWTRFKDPQLTALIEKAASANTDVRLAVFRVEEARANRTIARSRSRPIFSGSSNARRQKSSETSGGLGPPPGAPSTQNLFDLGLNLNWELDLFGRLRRVETAADAQLDASIEDRRSVLVAVFSEVAIAYVELRGLQAQFTVSERNIELASQSVDLTQLLVEQDLAPEIDRVRARAEVTELKARRNRLLSGQRAAAARIAFLTGQQPSQVMTELIESSAPMLPSASIPIGLPSEMLSRRADVRAAERRLASSSEQIGIEMADLMPRFSLTGVVGLSSADIGDLLDAESQTWSFGAAAQWPIFDSGGQRAEVSVARSRFGAAGAEYDAAILTALVEVETALAAYVYTTRELKGLQEARSDRDRAYELALIRYRSNTDTLFPALDAGQRLTSLNTEIAIRQQDLLIAEVNVYRALGGGWEDFDLGEDIGTD